MYLIKKLCWILGVIAIIFEAIAVIYGIAYFVRQHVSSIDDIQFSQMSYTKKINNLSNIVDNLEIDVKVLQKLQEQNYERRFN